jgi:hypothetical protein
VDTLSILNIRALVDGDNVTEANTKIGADNLVHANLVLVDGLVGQNDADSVATTLSTKQNSVTTEELKNLHGIWVKGNDRVVILCGLLDDQSVR